MNVVIAESWRAFEWWCNKNGIPTNDRKKAIPLIDPSDRYRLYGRNVRGAKLVVVGKNIPEHAADVFYNELRKFGFADPRRPVESSPDSSEELALDDRAHDAVPHDPAGTSG